MSSTNKLLDTSVSLSCEKLMPVQGYDSDADSGGEPENPKGAEKE